MSRKMRYLRTASESEVDRIWPAVRSAHLFETREELESFQADAPWRLLVGPQGCAAVVERWRDHLDILAIRGLWAREQMIPVLIDDVRALGGARGFTRLVSPLLAEVTTGHYETAGFEPYERLIAFRLEVRTGKLPEQQAPPEGIRLRPAIEADLSEVLEIDSECFSPFWAYEPRRLLTAYAEERMVVAEEKGRLIGYTLSTVKRGSGTIGRLAVAPGSRSRGIGFALLAEAVRGLVRQGARSVSLCTQDHNIASRALYRRAGMTELSERLVLMLCKTAT